MKRKLLRLKKVEDATGLKKSKIYSDVKRGLFPAPVRLGPKSVAWRSDEIDQWIESRPRVDHDESSSRLEGN